MSQSRRSEAHGTVRYRHIGWLALAIVDLETERVVLPGLSTSGF